MKFKTSVGSEARSLGLFLMVTWCPRYHNLITDVNLYSTRDLGDTAQLDISQRLVACEAPCGTRAIMERSSRAIGPLGWVIPLIFTHLLCRYTYLMMLPYLQRNSRIVLFSVDLFLAFRWTNVYVIGVSLFLRPDFSCATGKVAVSRAEAISTMGLTGVLSRGFPKLGRVK